MQVQPTDIQPSLTQIRQLLEVPYWHRGDFWISTAIGIAGALIAFGAYLQAGRAEEEAKKAKIEAEKVIQEVRKAAEAAKELARRRNLVEELIDASQKLQEIGTFLQQQQWVGVQIRTAEVYAICREAMSRWSDQLSKGSRNGVNTALTHLKTIGIQVAKQVQGELKPQDKRNLTDAHYKAAGHISDALGEAKQAAERDGSNDAN